MPEPSYHRRFVTALVALSVLASLAACSDSNDSATGTGASTSRPVATTAPSVEYRTEAAQTAPAGSTTVGMNRYQFDPPNPEVKAGTVILYLRNDDVPPDDPVDAFDRKHSVQVAGADGLPVATSARIEPQQAAVFTIESLAPGQYKFICSVGRHGMSGMEGTLTVTA